MLRYRASLGWALEHSRLMVVIMLACIAMNLWLFVVVPRASSRSGTPGACAATRWPTRASRSSP